MTVNDSFLRPP